MGIEPTPSHLRCAALDLPVELSRPWEQGGGEKGDIQVLVLGGLRGVGKQKG